MKRRKYGAGLEQQDFDSMCDGLSKAMARLTATWSKRVLALLLERAQLIATCSKVQFNELVRVLTGRVHRIKDLLDKVQCFGSGIMPKHLVGNAGITADTFLALRPKERAVLTDGVVFVKSRNDVLHIRADKLTADQLSKAVRSSTCAAGAKILAPHEQNAPRPKREPAYYTPISYNICGESLLVTCQQNRRTVRVQLTDDGLRLFLKAVAELKRKNKTKHKAA